MILLYANNELVTSVDFKDIALSADFVGDDAEVECGTFGYVGKVPLEEMVLLLPVFHLCHRRDHLLVGSWVAHLLSSIRILAYGPLEDIPVAVDGPELDVSDASVVSLPFACASRFGSYIKQCKRGILRRRALVRSGR